MAEQDEEMEDQYVGIYPKVPSDELGDVVDISEDEDIVGDLSVNTSRGGELGDVSANNSLDSPSSVRRDKAENRSPSPHQRRGRVGSRESRSPDTSRQLGSPASRSQYTPLTPQRPQYTSRGGGNRVGFWEESGLQVLLVVIIAVLVALVFYYRFNPPMGPGPAITYEGIEQHLNEQKRLFTAQKLRTWKLMRSVTKHVFNTENPEYPGVILMAGRESTKPTSHCLIRNVRKYFEEHFDRTSLLINTSNLSDSDPAEQKIQIHDKIENVIRPVRAFLAIINIETMSPEAAMIFHSYCDNTNAQYKNVLYILQVNIPDDYPTFTNELKGRDVEAYLTELWGTELGTDKTEPLLSRVANNIVIVEQENDETLEKIQC